MIISEKYGPQLDASDGTCGEVKLVRRWVRVKEKGGGIWGGQQGQYTYASQKEAEKSVATVKANNRPDLYPATLTVEPWWCWPGHFDPAIPCESDPVVDFAI